MKATGIVRRIDDLGRVVIPKEIRRTMRIREGDPLEIYTTREGEVIFKKYSLIGGLEDFAAQFCDVLNRSSGFTAAVTDRDAIIAITGSGKGAAGQAAVRRPGSGHGTAQHLSVSGFRAAAARLRQQRPLHGGCGGAYSLRGGCAGPGAVSVVGRADPRRGGVQAGPNRIRLFGAAYGDVNNNAGGSRLRHCSSWFYSPS